MTDSNEMREITVLSTEAYKMLQDIAEKRELELGETLDMIVTQWHDAAWDNVLDDYDHVREIGEIEYELQAIANSLTTDSMTVSKLAKDVTARRLLLEAKNGIPGEE